MLVHMGPGMLGESITSVQAGCLHATCVQPAKTGVTGKHPYEDPHFQLLSGMRSSSSPSFFQAPPKSCSQSHFQVRKPSLTAGRHLLCWARDAPCSGPQIPPTAASEPWWAPHGEAPPPAFYLTTRPPLLQLQSVWFKLIVKILSSRF